jgi:hypothetical protein
MEVPAERRSSANSFTCIFVRNLESPRNSFGRMMQKASCCLPLDGIARASIMASAPNLHFGCPSPRPSPLLPR